MIRSITSALLLMIFWMLINVGVAKAHKPSDSYIKINAGEDASSTLAIQWDISIKDLDYKIGLDTDQNGEITWGEVKKQRGAIEAYAFSNLKLKTDGHPSKLKLDDLLIARHSDGAYAALMIKTDAANDPRSLNLEYSLFFDVDPTHRGLVLFSNDVGASTYILSPSEPTVAIEASEMSVWRTFVQYVYEGVEHIWIGFDHILFLITLLLPAVLIRTQNQWQPVESFWPAAKAVLKIVTLFTIAHSITLWLAVTETVMLSPSFVEATIAFSIIVTALNNIFHVIKLPTWAIGFAFGLIHGFGFANVLVDLGLSSVSLAVSLLGFNVGVELGQMAIVLVFLPFAFLIRGTEFYRKIVLVGGSI